MLGPRLRLGPRGAEDIIGADLHQWAIQLAAGAGQVFDGLGVDRPAFYRLALGLIDLGIGGAIDHRRRLEFANVESHGRPVAKIERVDVQPGWPVTELPAQFAAQLP